MATRFWFELTTAPSISPAFDAGWEQTGSAVRRQLVPKFRASVANGAAASDVANVVTTTQDYLHTQFVSEPIPAQRFTGTFSLVLKCREADLGVNATLACVVRVLSQDGGTVRGTLFSNFSQDTEFPITGSEATRIVNAQAVTALTTQPGDRLCVEIGWNVAAPTTAFSGGLRYGIVAAGTADFALTSGLTTGLTPWCEFSQNVWDISLNNYGFARAESGMSCAEKIR